MALARLPSQEFLTCLSGDGGENAVWYSKLKIRLQREIFHRQIANEETLDQSASEISYAHMAKISAAFAKANTKESAERKVVCKVLWRMCGRGSEPGTLAWGGMRWSGTHSTPTIESPQPKGSKLKRTMFMAGKDRHSDVMIDFADYLVLQRGETIFFAEDKCFLFPFLGTSGGSVAISNWLKGLQPSDRPGALDKYKDVAVASLPPAPTAAGIRPGACDMLAMSMPAEIAVHTTGHDLRDLSALWEYLDCKESLVVVGCIVLCGWPALPYGQTGEGPKHPTLLALLDADVVEMRILEPIMDILFSFHDASPPMLLLDGHMRPMVHAMFATLLMYYNERFKEHEMDKVSAAMRDAMAKQLGSKVDVHQQILEWGAIILKRFISDNLHLTQRQGATDMSPLLSVLQNLNSVMVEQKSLMTDMRSRITTLETFVRDHGMSAPASQPAAPPAAASTPTMPSGPGPTCSGGALASAAAGSGVPAPPAQPVRPAASNASFLKPPGRGLSGGPEDTYEIKGVNAARFFFDCIVDHKGQLPPGVLQDSRRKSDCLKVLRPRTRTRPRPRTRTRTHTHA